MKRYILLLAASVMAFGAMTEAQAYDKKQVQAVKSGQKECPGCDLSNADLPNLDLRKANLANADLDGAVLTGALLAGANLKGASFIGARLNHVDFTNVNLTGVNVSKAWCDFTTKIPAGSGWTCEGAVLKHK